MLAAVCEIADVELSDIKRSRRGPGVNRARRFSVWAMRNKPLLTQAGIGKIIGMSANQVANVLRRLNLNQEPVAQWIESWYDHWESDK